MAEPRSSSSPARAAVGEVCAWIDAQVSSLRAEDVPLVEAGGRVAAADVAAGFDLPPFDRAAVDGIAVRAEDTVGASPYSPCLLRWVAASDELPVGGAAQLNAGAPLPRGADAVIALHLVGREAGGAAAITEPVAAASGTEPRGCQVATGNTLVAAGRLLRAAELGLLASAGWERVAVVRRPLVRCVIAGAMLETARSPSRAQVYEASGPALRAVVERDGGRIVEATAVARDRASLRDALLRPGADIILVVGGTGPGADDEAAAALAEAGELVIDGVALRHADSAGLGRAGGVPVVLLPGSPAACLLAYEVLAGRAIRRLGGRNGALPFPTRTMTMARKVVSEISMAEVRPVRCATAGSVEPVPPITEIGLMALAGADGFLLIPEGSEGYRQGAAVSVYLYEGYDCAQP